MTPPPIFPEHSERPQGRGPRVDALARALERGRTPRRRCRNLAGRRLSLALAAAVFGGLFIGPSAHAQVRASVSAGVSFASYSVSHTSSSLSGVSLWYGTRPHGPHYPSNWLFDVRLGLDIAASGGHVSSVGLAPWLPPGHRRGHRSGFRHRPGPTFGYGPWVPCGPLVWDAWYGYRAICTPIWVPIDRYGYPVHAWPRPPRHPYWVGRPGARPSGISIGVHLSFGEVWGHTPYLQQSPRWVARAAPRAARPSGSAGFGIGGGGWVTQQPPRFKEDPGPRSEATRTAVRRPEVRDEATFTRGGAAIGTGRAAVPSASVRSGDGAATATPSRRARPESAAGSRGTTTVRSTPGAQPAAQTETRVRGRTEVEVRDRSEPERARVRSWYVPVQPEAAPSPNRPRIRGSEPRATDPDTGRGAPSAETSRTRSVTPSSSTPGRVRGTTSAPRVESRSPPSTPRAQRPRVEADAPRVAPSRERRGSSVVSGSSRPASSTSAQPRDRARSGAERQRTPSRPPRVEAPSASPTPRATAPNRSGGRSTASPATGRSSGGARVRGGG